MAKEKRKRNAATEETAEDKNNKRTLVIREHTKEAEEIPQGPQQKKKEKIEEKKENIEENDKAYFMHRFKGKICTT